MKERESIGTRLFTWVVEVPAVVIIFVMIIHVTANALLRAFADHPLENTLEVVQYWYLPIVALLGFMAAQARGQHIATDLVYARLPRAVQPFILFVVFAVGALICGGFAWFGWSEALDARSIGQHAGVSTVPSWPVYFLVPISFAVLTVQLSVKAIQALRGQGLDLEETEPEDAMVLAEIEAQEAKR